MSDQGDAPTVGMKAYDVLVAMRNGPPKWLVMLAPGCDLKQAAEDARRYFGAERVLRVEPVR